jgi:hypothetical protein
VGCVLRWTADVSFYAGEDERILWATKLALRLVKPVPVVFSGDTVYLLRSVPEND